MNCNDINIRMLHWTIFFYRYMIKNKLVIVLIYVVYVYHCTVTATSKYYMLHILP